ncbi:unnamed protein product [Medioppia subpectinata]|uniref:DM domain-containing protein n=1 Tax=Medioppia subpectinata TaxID=1979941 RepID=A0A7R9KIB9_9ACAR|nr:unnamed protein product [Medioppia subpectinata]CAG2104220.1 unnamed protein product [Medioppia subpectinata]
MIRKTVDKRSDVWYPLMSFPKKKQKSIPLAEQCLRPNNSSNGCDSEAIDLSKSVKHSKPDDRKQTLASNETENTNDSESASAGTTKKKRNPFCQTCQNHVDKDGHKRRCPTKDCPCAKCEISRDKRVLMAKTISVKRKLKEDLNDLENGKLEESQVFDEPVFKKQRSHPNESAGAKKDKECESDDENSNSRQSIKPLDKIQIKDMVDKMWPNLLSVQNIDKILLWILLRGKSLKNYNPKTISNSIVKASENLPESERLSAMASTASPLKPIPMRSAIPSIPVSFANLNGGEGLQCYRYIDPNMFSNFYPKHYPPMGSKSPMIK